MDTKTFLSTLLGGDGYYCVVGIKERTIQKIYNSLEAAFGAAENFDLEGYNSYFALSTFVTDTSRKAENVRRIKSLFLDLDCGPGKPYATQVDALNAFNIFRHKCKLPKPTFTVNSGGGIHIYWVLSEFCTREAWLPVAESLKAACARFNLHADPAITADAARILRVPGTHNYKFNPPRAVSIIRATDTVISLEDFSALLPVVLMPVLPEREFTKADRDDMQLALGTSNYVKKFSRLIIKTANNVGCGQFKKALEEPNNVTYPEWLHLLSIAKHCEEGDSAVHLISQGYSGYSAEETDKIAKSIDTPHLCSTFEKDNPKGCEGCPHRGKIRSPIKLCMEVREAAPEDNIVEESTQEEGATSNPEHEDILLTPKLKVYMIPQYPFPYFRGVNGGVYMRIKDKEGNLDEVEVYKNDLYLVQRLRDPMLGPCFLFRHHTKREGIHEFVVPSVKLSSKDEFRKEMGMNDIFLLKQETLMSYIGRWITELQNTQDEIKVKTQFGWTDDYKSFIIGDREVFANKIVPNPPGGRTAQYIPYFRKKGTLENWKKVTEFYNRPGFEEHQFMFGLSFGSPLMEFIPNIAGAIYHISSGESGFGKTTGQWGGASVWGNHKQLVLKGKDTGNSVWNRAEIMKNIVLYMDELSNFDSKDASDFAYAVTDGVQRNRQSNGGQNMERMRGEEWSLLVGTSGNNSLLEKMTEHRTLPKGEAQRVIEARIRPLLFTPQDAIAAGALNENLSENYGHAGEVYIQHVLANLDTVKKLLKQNIESIILDAGLTPQNRFWSAEAGAVITGVIISKHLGLVDWDVDALRRWIIQHLKRLKAGMKEMDIDIGDLIGNFYADNVRGILRIKSSDTGVTDPALEALILPDATPISRWVARHEYDLNKLYVLPKPFKDWCVKQGHNYATICDMVKDTMQGENIKIRLGRGTKIALPPQHVIAMTWSYEGFVSKQQDQAGMVTVDDPNKLN